MSAASMAPNPRIRHTVEHWTDLPRASGSYVRSAADPRFLTQGGTGENYLRADGAPWEHHGYRHEVKGEGGVRPSGLIASNNVCIVADPAAAECDAYWLERHRQERAL